MLFGANLSVQTAERLNSLEAQVDKMQETFEQAHIDRLNSHECTTRAGMLFINTITDFERVADHAINIAWSVQSKPKQNTGSFTGDRYRKLRSISNVRLYFKLLLHGRSFTGAF